MPASQPAGRLLPWRSAIPLNRSGCLLALDTVCRQTLESDSATKTRGARFAARSRTVLSPRGGAVVSGGYFTDRRCLRARWGRWIDRGVPKSGVKDPPARAKRRSTRAAAVSNERAASRRALGVALGVGPGSM